MSLMLRHCGTRVTGAVPPPLRRPSRLKLLERVTPTIVQLVGADQFLVAIAIDGDAVAGEHLAHNVLHPFGVVVDLDHVFAQDAQGHVLRGGRAVAAQQLHQHQGLIDVAHGHSLGD